MTTTSDIYRAAHHLISKYGEMAPIGVAIKIDEYQLAGDEVNCAIWHRVGNAVEELMDDNSMPENCLIH